MRKWLPVLSVPNDLSGHKEHSDDARNPVNPT